MSEYKINKTMLDKKLKELSLEEISLIEKNTGYKFYKEYGQGESVITTISYKKKISSMIQIKIQAIGLNFKNYLLSEVIDEIAKNTLLIGV